jgi:hypothetical protein
MLALLYRRLLCERCKQTYSESLNNLKPTCKIIFKFGRMQKSFHIPGLDFNFITNSLDSNSNYLIQFPIEIICAPSKEFKEFRIYLQSLKLKHNILPDEKWKSRNTNLIKVNDKNTNITIDNFIDSWLYIKYLYT